MGWLEMGSPAREKASEVIYQQTKKEEAGESPQGVWIFSSAHYGAIV